MQRQARGTPSNAHLSCTLQEVHEWVCAWGRVVKEREQLCKGADLNVGSEWGLGSPSTTQPAEIHLWHDSVWSVSLLGLPSPQGQLAGFSGAMTMGTFRNALHGGHCWRCHWVPPYLGFPSWVDRKQRKFPADCLYSPASKRRVRFGVENVAQDECKPKKPHLFHGSSLYPQSREIILLTEKTY